MLGREAVRQLDRPRRATGPERSRCSLRSPARRPARSADLQAAARFPPLRLAASRLEVVSRMAAASTSCSACASMSAARTARVAIRGDDQNFGRAGDEIDAHFARQQLFRRGHVDVARGRRCGPPSARCACRRRTPRSLARRPSGKRPRRRAARRAVNVAHGRGRGDADIAERPPPAPESPSSSGWKAADSGRRECTRPRYRAAARSARGTRPGLMLPQPFR